MLSFKFLIYVAVLFFIVGINWRFTLGRIIVYMVIAVATIVFFATLDRIPATLASLIVPLGIFSAPQVEKMPRLEHRLTLWGGFSLLVFYLLFTNSFDPNDGVVSHNFIAVFGLYLMVLCTAWRRFEILLLCFGLSAMVLTVGSRSGTAVFLMVGLWIISPRAAIFIALAGVALFLSGYSIDALPAQFERNYEGGIDQRFFIWAEFMDHALRGSLFRREDFDFMVTFELDRNFHNSILEAYYRTGPFAMLLLTLHLALIKNSRHNRVAFIVFLALFAKGFFDTYLWFTPIDLLIFKEYGSRLFDSKKIHSHMQNRDLHLKVR